MPTPRTCRWEVVAVAHDTHAGVTAAPLQWRGQQRPSPTPPIGALLPTHHASRGLPALGKRLLRPLHPEEGRPVAVRELREGVSGRQRLLEKALP